MSDCQKAMNRDNVRRLQRALYLKSKQEGVNTRFRRYLTFRSKGRGFGWDKYPNRKLYAMGMVYIGSGMLEYVSKPVHDLR